MRPMPPPVGGSISASRPMISSISSSTLSGSFLPFAPNSFIPLSSNGLCDAEITMPAAAPFASTICATAGVGTTSTLITSTPIDANPAAIAASSMSPDSRVSRPIMTQGLPSRPCGTPFAAQWPAAAPSCIARRAVSSILATPRTPSVPNSRCLLIRSALRHADKRGPQYAVVHHVAALHLVGDGVRRQVRVVGVADRLVEVRVELLADGLDRRDAGLLQKRLELLGGAGNAAHQRVEVARLLSGLQRAV